MVKVRGDNTDQTVRDREDRDKGKKVLKEEEENFKKESSMITEQDEEEDDAIED